MRTALWLLLVPAFFLFAQSGGAQTQSLGFFPSTIELENGLRGQRYESKTTLVNQTGEPRIFALAAGGDTAPWTTMTSANDPDASPIDQITVPAESEVEVIVTIAIPETAPNGEVRGVNTYDGYTQEAFRTREGLVTGFQQPVRIVVTGDQVLDLRVGDVSARTVEVGQPLRVRTQLTNQGNVDTVADLALEFFALPPDASAQHHIDSFASRLDSIAPGQSGTVETAWDTAERAPGRYRADYAVSLEGERLALGSFEFELVPAGSLTRTGVIVDVTVVDPVAPGAINRADVQFENTGQVDSLAHFAGHVYMDGVAIAEAESPDALTVRPGEQVTLSAFFRLPQGEGDYELRGRVFFEGSQTDEAAAAFQVAGAGNDTIITAMAVGGALAVAVGSALVGGAWLSRRHR
jgi:hypothetical protein